MANRRIAVVGGGVMGLSAAYHLHRLGCRQLTVFDRFPAGHDRGSSHGASRITRSSYHSPVYIDLIRVAHGEDWPRLERDLGRKLVHPSPGCFYGPSNGLYDAFRDAVTASGADVEIVGPEEGRRRFPLFRFDDAEGVLDDRTAGLVAAADTVAGLHDHLERAGVALRRSEPVVAIEPRGDGVRVRTASDALDVDAVVVTAGPWTSKLVPTLEPRLTVLRQTVGYFAIDAPPDALRLGAFPVWAYLGREDNAMWYGLPEFGRAGIKAAHHAVLGSGDDPASIADPVSEAAVEILRSFLQRQLVPAVTGVLHAEHCLYTSTDDEDFILDVHPDHPGIVIGAGFSGHGFKFAPVVGRILAELARTGTCALPEYVAHRAMFAAG